MDMTWTEDGVLKCAPYYHLWSVGKRAWVVPTSGEAVWDEVDQTVYHLGGFTSDGMVILMDNDVDWPLPDLRHVSQVRAL